MFHTLERQLTDCGAKYKLVPKGNGVIPFEELTMNDPGRLILRLVLVLAGASSWAGENDKAVVWVTHFA